METTILDESQMKKIFLAEKKIKKIVDEVYRMLQEREINPSGKFDDGGRWWADNEELINVRRPSRAYPYSEMVACRTKRYVKEICWKYKCRSVKTLRRMV